MARPAVAFAALLLIWLAIPVLIAFSQVNTELFLPIVAKNLSASTPTFTAAPGRLLITEILYHPAGAEPAQEWMEIYNAGGAPLDLTDYKIGDEELPGGNEGMHRFPAGTIIQPGQVIVIAYWSMSFQAGYGFKADFELRESDPAVPTLEKYTAWASGNAEMVNSGDEILLIDSADQLVDALSWGNSNFAFFPPIPNTSTGYSLERRPANQDTNSAADWSEQPAPAPKQVNLMPPGAATHTPTPTGEWHTATPTLYPTQTGTPTRAPRPTQVDGGLVISEVLFKPAGSDPAMEWIELYNASLAAIDLSDFKLGDEETPAGGEGMFRFPAGAIISSDQVLVIANLATAFYDQYGFKPAYEIVESDPQVPNLTPYTAWSGGTIVLGNMSDELLILNAANRVVDALSWGLSTWAFDPACPEVGFGHSLERLPADVDTDTALDWFDQLSPRPGQVEHSH